MALTGGWRIVPGRLNDETDRAGGTALLHQRRAASEQRSRLDSARPFGSAYDAGRRASAPSQLPSLRRSRPPDSSGARPRHRLARPRRTGLCTRVEGGQVTSVRPVITIEPDSHEAVRSRRSRSSRAAGRYGGLRDGGRQRACGRRLHGGERDAELRGRRAVEDDRGRGARRRARRGRGDADAAALQHLVGPADRRRGHRDDREPRSDAAGAAGAVRAGGGGARGRARGGAAGGAARAGLPGPVRWPGAAARHGARRRAQLPPAAERRGRRRFDGRRSDGRGRRPAVRRAGGRDGGSRDAGTCRRRRAPGRERRGSDGRSHADGRRARCDGHVRRADGRRVPPGRWVQRRRTPADGTRRR